MIINTGARTDTVQYYTDWLLNRFNEGFVLVRNPFYPQKITRYELTPEKVDAVQFCSKNYKSLLPYIKQITEKFNTYFHYTVTAYGKDVEPGVPDIEESINILIELSNLAGRKRVSWRYDPILLTKDYTIKKHIETFNYMAKQLAPYIDRCIFSFVEMYKKLAKNMPEIILLTENDKEILAESLGEIAERYGIYIQICGANGDYSKYNIYKSGCMTLDIMAKANILNSKT